MTSVTLNLDDSVIKRLGTEAEKRGMSMERLVEEILDRHSQSLADRFHAWAERARREGWQSDGPFLTDDEMYTR